MPIHAYQYASISLSKVKLSSCVWVFQGSQEFQDPPQSGLPWQHCRPLVSENRNPSVSVRFSHRRGGELGAGVHPTRQVRSRTFSSGETGRPGEPHTGNLQLMVLYSNKLSLSCNCEQGEAAAGIREDRGAAGGFRLRPDLPTQPV